MHLVSLQPSWGFDSMTKVLVPRCLYRLNSTDAYRASKAKNQRQADKIIAKYKKQLWSELGYHWVQGGRPSYTDGCITFLRTTGYYTKGHTDPNHFDHRDTESSRHVASFSPGGVPPSKPDTTIRKPKIPLSKRISRIPYTSGEEIQARLIEARSFKY